MFVAGPVNGGYIFSRTGNISMSSSSSSDGRIHIHIHISSQFVIIISSVRMEPAGIQSQSRESVLELSPGE